MATTSEPTTNETPSPGKPKQLGRWIALGLVAGLLCGLLFGEYCAFLDTLGKAYVGLLQMTVLPYLVLALIAKMGRLNWQQARQLGLAIVVVLVVLWLIAVVLIVISSLVLPSIPGATFFSSDQARELAPNQSFLATFIPTNVFHSLSEEFVPGVVVFCLFFGVALIPIPGKEPFLNFLDLCTDAIGQINTFLVRLAPIGLFALTAAAAGTLRLDELSKLQAYLIVFALACLAAGLGILPLLVSSVTRIGYRDMLRAAQEPVLTAIATGKLFVVLPQIVEKCEQLLTQESESDRALDELGESTANVLVPLAYPFPHIGKILAFVFVSFAAWYVGRGLTTTETAAMASTGVVSSFASPLISIPYLLDQYRLPQDLLPLFILPGFLTTRLADVVGVLHLMALTLIVSCALQGRLYIRWRRIGIGIATLVVCLGIVGVSSRWYLATTTLDYTLDDRFMSLKVSSPCRDVVVYRSRDEVPQRQLTGDTTLQRVRDAKVLRVGYHPDHLPYSFFNRQGQLVGMDVELMHRLATSLDVRLEFVPFEIQTVVDQLESGEIDLAVGGLLMNPERLMHVEFTQPYQTVTIGIAVPDHQRNEFDSWDDPRMSADVRLGVAQSDLVAVAQRRLPRVEIVPIESMEDYFTGRCDNLDGVIIAAEEGAAWNVLYPAYTVVVPQPVTQRPIGMATRHDEGQWVRFLDRWLDFERLDGTFTALHEYWIQGGGTQEHAPRWCLLRDVLHWIP